MNRRKMLRLAGAAMAAMPCAPGVVHAGIAHGCFRERPGHVRCQVGYSNAPYIEPQPCRSLCWTNALAYVMRGWGMKLSVASVMHRLGIDDRCRTRNDLYRVMSAAGHWIDDTGRGFFVRTMRLPDLGQGSNRVEDFQPLVEALSRRPLIIGTRGHARVLTQMTYVDAPLVNMRHERLTLRDPWTGTPNLVTMDHDDMPERMFAVALDVRRA